MLQFVEWSYHRLCPFLLCPAVEESPEELNTAGTIDEGADSLINTYLTIPLYWHRDEGELIMPRAEANNRQGQMGPLIVCTPSP